MENGIVKKIQEVELDALVEFQKICNENNIRFYLRGGSVMGAVKYHGFIPWDDDMDIAVPREDYERLIKLVKDLSIAGKYRINSYRYCKELPCYFPRMVLEERERVRLGLPKNTKLGLHLMDIFPLDGAPDNVVVRKIYFGKVYLYRALASLGTFYRDEMVNMHTRKQQCVINILRIFKIDRLIDQRQMYGKLEKLYTKYDWKEKKYAGTITASLFSKEIFPREVWGEGAFMNFESTKVRVPTEYDIYLKKLYGKDYLNKEPDLSHRKSHLG